MNRTALVAGATGLVGGELVKLLLANDAYERVVVLVRKEIGLRHAKLEQAVINFDELDQLPIERFAGADVFCALGTTIKKAGSQDNFRLVDYTYPMVLGRLAKQYGAKAFLIITAMNSDERSLFFYSRVKGEVERDLAKLGLPQLHIFRPSLITGERQEHRTGEQFAAKLSAGLPFLFAGPMARYKPNPATDIAKAMLLTALAEAIEPSPHIISPGDIAKLAAAH